MLRVRLVFLSHFAWFSVTCVMLSTHIIYSYYTCAWGRLLCWVSNKLYMMKYYSLLALHIEKCFLLNNCWVNETTKLDTCRAKTTKNKDVHVLIRFLDIYFFKHLQFLLIINHFLSKRNKAITACNVQVTYQLPTSRAQV